VIFGRKRRSAPETEELVESPASPSDEREPDEDSDDVIDAGTPDEADPDEFGDDESDAGIDVDVDDDDESVDPDEDDEDDDDLAALREDGPFDSEEVDLDADDVARLDFGSLVVTPIEGMELQLQVEQQTQTIQSALVVHEGAAIEIALFAAPARGGLAAEVRDELVTLTDEAGGTATIEDGPFGPQLFREVEVTTPDGQRGLHRSRIWLVEGPRWMLRGVLMGAALDEGTPGRELMEDFFRNLVVNRGSDPRAPGDLIPLTIPQSLVEQQEG
jgi:hypothetical protein